MDIRRLNAITSRKLSTVSSSVTPMWESMALCLIWSTKQRATRLGLEKKKLSIHFRLALTSHRTIKRTKMSVRQEAISWWCLLCFLMNSSCLVNSGEAFFLFPESVVSSAFMCQILP